MAELMAIRHPKRGKAHRKFGRWETVVCRSDSTFGQRMYASLTEAVPLRQTAPEDRCKRCWPDTKETR